MSGINWRPRTEHPDTFEDGERLLVAVPCRDNRDPPRIAWNMSVITFHAEEEGFSWFEAEDEGWGWDWTDVEWWAPVKELEPEERP